MNLKVRRGVQGVIEVLELHEQTFHRGIDGFCISAWHYLSSIENGDQDMSYSKLHSDQSMVVDGCCEVGVWVRTQHPVDGAGAGTDGEGGTPELLTRIKSLIGIALHDLKGLVLKRNRTQ